MIKLHSAYISKTIKAAYSNASNADALKKVLPLLIADDNLTASETLEEMNKFYMAVQSAK